jgi:hypothetical protein
MTDLGTVRYRVMPVGATPPRRKHGVYGESALKLSTDYRVAGEPFEKSNPKGKFHSRVETPEGGKTLFCGFAPRQMFQLCRQPLRVRMAEVHAQAVACMQDFLVRLQDWAVHLAQEEPTEHEAGSIQKSYLSTKTVFDAYVAIQTEAIAKGALDEDEEAYIRAFGLKFERAMKVWAAVADYRFVPGPTKSFCVLMPRGPEPPEERRPPFTSAKDGKAMAGAGEGTGTGAGAGAFRRAPWAATEPKPSRTFESLASPSAPPAASVLRPKASPPPSPPRSSVSRKLDFL